MIDLKKNINGINIFLRNFTLINNKLTLRKILSFIKKGDYRGIKSDVFIEFLKRKKDEETLYNNIREFSYQKFLDSRMPLEIFKTNNENLIINLLNFISIDEMRFVQFNRIFKEIDDNETLIAILNAIVKSNFNIIKSPGYLDNMYYGVILKLNFLLKNNLTNASYFIFTGMLIKKKTICDYIRKNIWNSLFAVRDRVFSQIRNHIITKIAEKENDFDSVRDIFKGIEECDLWHLCDMTDDVSEAFKNVLDKMEFLKNIDAIMERCFQKYNILMKSIYNTLEKISEYLFEENCEREINYDWSDGLNEFAINVVNKVILNFKSTIDYQNNFIFENLGSIEDSYYKALSLLMDSDIKNVAFDGDLSNEENLIGPLNDSLDVYLGEAINDLEAAYNIQSKRDLEIISDVENSLSEGIEVDDDRLINENGVNENDKIVVNSDKSKNDLSALATNIINELRDELSEDRVFENRERVKELIKEVIEEKYNKNVKYSVIINNAIEDALKVENFEDL
ncbi:MAG TPA: hypothetical protein PLG34_08510 [Spirochaetota bacterium]|jgi:hypothetical protein|nr:MAG: hypothetical protein BWX91_00235 [Spirochaetes bacterium ADurb.Bin133]HNZ25615.1 hypothetical protein [Spirochaetota bacterium]HPY88008.1 hypothetical protein [Spirochaetota bacterium]